MASKPEIEHGIDDKDTWWYRCPVCHDPLDYKQEICGWCYEVIEWDEADTIHGKKGAEND